MSVLRNEKQLVRFEYDFADLTAGKLEVYAECISK